MAFQMKNAEPVSRTELFRLMLPTKKELEEADEHLQQHLEPLAGPRL